MDPLPAEHQDGISIAPLLTGAKKKLERDTLYWHYPHYHRTKPYGAIRKGDLKLIEFFEDGRLELFDLKADPYERDDLAKAMPEKAAELLVKLKGWRKEVNAQMPTPNPRYDPAKDRSNNRGGKS
jgi:arylsulfatase A-like enzyme